MRPRPTEPIAAHTVMISISHIVLISVKDLRSRGPCRAAVIAMAAPVATWRYVKPNSGLAS